MFERLDSSHQSSDNNVTVSQDVVETTTTCGCVSAQQSDTRDRGAGAPNSTLAKTLRLHGGCPIIAASSWSQNDAQTRPCFASPCVSSLCCSFLFCLQHCLLDLQFSHPRPRRYMPYFSSMLRVVDCADEWSIRFGYRAQNGGSAAMRKTTRKPPSTTNQRTNFDDNGRCGHDAIPSVSTSHYSLFRSQQ